MLIVFNLLYAIVAGPAGALSDRIERRTMIIVSWVAYALIYAGLAMAQSAWHVWVLFAVYGIYYGSTEGVSRALVADMVGAERRGSAYGVFNAAIGFSVLPAALLPVFFGKVLATGTGLGQARHLSLGQPWRCSPQWFCFFNLESRTSKNGCLR